NPSTQKVFVVADERGNVLLGQSAVQPDVREIRVQSRTGEHADASLIAFRVTARALERLVRQLQQNAVLWIHGPGFQRRETEKPCVKMARLLQDWRRLHIARMAQVSCRHARFQDLLVCKPGNRLNALGQVMPELVEVARAWKTAGHPDNGDIELVVHRRY